MKSCIYIFFDL